MCDLPYTRGYMVFNIPTYLYIYYNIHYMLKSLSGVIIYILGIPKHKGVKFTKTSDMLKMCVSN